MDCYRPLRIKNKYTGDFLHVACRSCDACLIKQANIKAFELSQTIKQYKYSYFITLTYDNDHVPYILKGYNYVFRGQQKEDFPEVLGTIPQLINWNDKYLYLTNHAVKGAIGVLWHYDVQLFLKRFRKYINKHYGKRKFIYFCVGEYGSKYGRPHEHIVICSDELLFEEVQDACYKNWSYHNWSRFLKNGQNEACKRCTETCAAYISSYVNCNSCHVKISTYKCFCQKTYRSKNLNFGLDRKILAQYKEDVRRLHDGIVNERNRRIFYYLDNSTIDNVSFRLLPSRYISTCFHKFKSWNKLSIDAKFSRASNIVQVVAELKNRRLPLDSVVNGQQLSSMDLSFFRAYRRFLDINKWFLEQYTLFPLWHYVVLMDNVLKYYHSCILYEQFKSFEELGSDNYFMSLIDTGVEKGNGYRAFKIVNKLSLTTRQNLLRINLDCPNNNKHKLDRMCDRYKMRLLPKHLNDVSNIFGYDSFS